DTASGFWLDPERPSPSRPQRPAEAAPLRGALHAASVGIDFAARLCRNLLPGHLLCEQWYGTEPASGAPLRVLYLGGGDNRAHLHQLAFSRPAPDQPRRAVHWLRANAALARLQGEADLLLLDLGPPLLWLVGCDRGMAVPA